jgi:hypothetical protein
MEVSFAIPVTIADHPVPAALIEEVAEELGQEVEGIGEVVGWDLSGAAGTIQVAGEDQYEDRLLAIIRTQLAEEPRMATTDVEITVFAGDDELSRRRIPL